MTLPETTLEIADRHVDSLQRMIAFQKMLVARMEADKDENGAAVGQTLMNAFRQSLKLALKQRDYHLHRDEADRPSPIT